MLFLQSVDGSREKPTGRAANVFQKLAALPRRQEWAIIPHLGKSLCPHLLAVQVKCRGIQNHYVKIGAGRIGVEGRIHRQLIAGVECYWVPNSQGIARHQAKVVQQK